MTKYEIDAADANVAQADVAVANASPGGILRMDAHRVTESYLARYRKSTAAPAPTAAP